MPDHEEIDWDRRRLLARLREFEAKMMTRFDETHRLMDATLRLLEDSQRLTEASVRLISRVPKGGR